MTPMTHAQKSPRGDVRTSAGIWVVGIGAAILSWDGWFLLAEMCGWRWYLAVVLPLTVDVYVVTSARVWLRLSWVSSRTRTFAAWSTTFAVVVSMAANGAFHLMQWNGWHKAPAPVVLVVSGLAPLMLALVAHLQARLNHDLAARGEADARAAGEAAARAAKKAERMPSRRAAPEAAAGAVTGAIQEPSPGPSQEPSEVPSQRPRRAVIVISKEPDAEKARAAYRKSVRAGTPLSDRALGEMFSRSRTWGKSRIAEVDSGPALANAQAQ
jgi:hypothetical protein